jgi:hypothetical protein
VVVDFEHGEFESVLFIREALFDLYNLDAYPLGGKHLVNVSSDVNVELECLYQVRHEVSSPVRSPYSERHASSEYPASEKKVGYAYDVIGVKVRKE